MKMALIDSSKSGNFKLTGSVVIATLIGFFVIIFAANGIMAYLAVQSFSGVQTEKPYENGLAFNRDIERARAQDAQGWHVDEAITRKETGDVMLTIRITDSIQKPISGVTVDTLLKSPTDSHKDCFLEVTEQSAGVYAGATQCGAGQWDIDMRALKNGDIVYHSINRIILH
ncbi:MAG: FixH family protein [Hyphomicrobiales bacterium]|nr:FixH family protein [Hyphomicrobiales bacterium]